MSDPVSIRDAGNASVDVAADDVVGFGRVQVVKPAFGDDGAATLVSAANPLPIAGTVALDAGTLAALETINAVTGGLTDAQLRAAAVPVTLGGSAMPLPAGAATDATLAALAAISEQLRELSDTLLVVAQAQLERMPRVTSNDQMTVAVELGVLTSVGTVSSVTAMTNLLNIQRLGTSPLHGETLTQAGLVPIYNNLVVT